jgi:hypothetical protein
MLCVSTHSPGLRITPQFTAFKHSPSQPLKNGYSHLPELQLNSHGRAASAPADVQSAYLKAIEFEQLILETRKKKKKKNCIFRNTSHAKHLRYAFSNSKITNLKLKRGSRNEPSDRDQ